MVNLPVLKHNGQRILTTQQLAEVYETNINNVQNNFINHKDNFVEGKHYYLLKGEKLREFKNNLQVNNIDLQISNMTRSLYLWTERGANRHCKILDTDKAWEQFDNLEETYFRVKETSTYNIRDKQQKKPNLSSVNMMAKILAGAYEKAGVDPKFTVVAINNLYEEQTGIHLPLPIKVEEEKLYDCTEIAKELSIYSKTGNPHNKAISAIIQKLDIDESLIVKTPFMRNGHSDFTFQYKPLVFEKVKLWIKENNYPNEIKYTDRKGYDVKCKVIYRDMAVDEVKTV